MVHLNVRSSYSLLNGLMSVETIARKAKELNMKAVALTDFHVLYGALNFQIACKKNNIKPIFGMDVTFEDFGIFTLLAKNIKGYQSLMKISYMLSNSSSINLGSVSVMLRDCIVIVHGEGGPFENDAASEDFESLIKTIKIIRESIPDFYIGISHQESEFFKQVNRILIDVANSQGIVCVALPKVYYENEDDDDLYRVVRAIDKSTYFDDKTLVSSPNRHFIGIETIKKIYGSALVQPIDEIVGQCDVNLFDLKSSMPSYETGLDVDSKIYLKKLSETGLYKRLSNNVSDEYLNRLNYELDIINSMGFSDYFLIVYDVIRFAKKEGYYVGPGRGSSAGSLVAYCLGITEIDPIKYDLLFERFLNPQRITMPDIDIDFPDDKRDRVIKYAMERYGKEHVGHIVTFGTMKAKQAFRDVARVFQVPPRVVDSIAKFIQAPTLLENYESITQFKSMINSDKNLQRVFSISTKLEGLLRHASMHPAGIVISDRPLLEVAPITNQGSHLDVLQYDMSHLERIGLIKIDFLGLRNLTIIDKIVHQIRQKTPFNIMTIPLDDTKTFKMITEGDTVGIFQLESEGMKSLLKRLKPNKFMDIVDTIALYRPGPMENIPLYLSSRKNPESVNYLHEDLRKISEDTYGVLVYQEQIMQVAQIMAGFDLAKADILRKAMSKKDSTILATLRVEFIEGVIARGHNKALAIELYNLIEKFANYGFNKSHSVAYGLVSYQMAYLKANYPLYFYTHLLSSVMGSEVKTRQYLDECKRRNIAIYGPNINKSSLEYSIENDGIRLPLTLIKGISISSVKTIKKHQYKKGYFTSYFDAIAQLCILGIKRNQLESLIKSGSFDSFASNRKDMLMSLDDALRYANIIKVEQEGEITLNKSLVSEPTLVNTPKNIKDGMTYEIESLGFYLTDHPTLNFKDDSSTSISGLKVATELVKIVGLIDNIKNHKTKHGDSMVFLQLSDNTGSIDGVVFPKIYSKYKDLLTKGEIYFFRGKVQQMGSLIIDDIEPVEKELT